MTNFIIIFTIHYLPSLLIMRFKYFGKLYFLGDTQAIFEIEKIVFIKIT